jgi:hypothetical protein
MGFPYGILKCSIYFNEVSAKSSFFSVLFFIEIWRFSLIKNKHLAQLCHQLT